MARRAKAVIEQQALDLAAQGLALARGDGEDAARPSHKILTEDDIPAWMERGMIIYCVDGELPQWMVTGLTPDFVLNLLIDTLSVARKMDGEYTQSAIKAAFESGERAATLAQEADDASDT